MLGDLGQGGKSNRGATQPAWGPDPVQRAPKTSPKLCASHLRRSLNTLFKPSRSLPATERILMPFVTEIKYLTVNT